MVYDSDFSTRRVYSSRPIVTSYSISPYDYDQLPLAARRRPDMFVTYQPGNGKGRKQHRVVVPFSRLMHQRLVPVSAPPRRHQSVNVYDALEYGRSGNQFVLVKYRASPPPPMPRSRVTYIEDVTNLDAISRENRSMQRDMDNMLYRYSMGLELPYQTPSRSSSEVKEVADLRRMYVRERNPGLVWGPLSHTNPYRMPVVYKPDPAAILPSSYYHIGRGNLACLSFAGGRPIPKRRRFYPGYEDKVADDVTYRSFYSKMRNAANIASIAAHARGRTPVYQPLHYSRKTLFGEEPKREVKESKWVQRAMANTKEPVKKAAPPVKQDSIKESPIARRESLTQEPAQQPSGRPINVTLPNPRKSVTEIIREDLPKVVNLPEQSITVKRPASIKEASPAAPVIEAKVEETVVIPTKAKEPTPPPKEPTPTPKESTPPPKEPTPPPREPTPPPKEPTPPPREPTPPPAEVAVEEAVVVASEDVAVEEAAVEPSEASAAADIGAVSEEGSNKGEVEDIQLEDEITLDEVCEVQVEENDLEIEEDPPAESAVGAESQEQVEVEVVEPLPTEPEVIAVDEVQAEADSAQAPDVQEPPVEPEVEPEPEPVVVEESTAGVSILVADTDGPVEVEAVPENGDQVPLTMTVDEIQAEAERRRDEFARLLEEHHEIVEKLEQLEHTKKVTEEEGDQVKLELNQTVIPEDFEKPLESDPTLAV